MDAAMQDAGMEGACPPASTASHQATNAAMEVDATAPPAFAERSPSSPSPPSTSAAAAKRFPAMMPPLQYAKRTRPAAPCFECGTEAPRDELHKCRGCKELICRSCSLRCGGCERVFCTLHCAGWTVEIPTLEQQRVNDVPAEVLALHSDGAIGCKRCARRHRKELREQRCFETPQASPRAQAYDTPV